MENMREIVVKFHRQLEANGCIFDRLENELQTLITHVSAFLKMPLRARLGQSCLKRV